MQEEDNKILEEIAKKTHGVFLKITDNKKLIEFLNSKKKEEIKNKKYIKKEYLFQIPLFFAFLSLLFYTYFVNKRAIL